MFNFLKFEYPTPPCELPPYHPFLYTRRTNCNVPIDRLVMNQSNTVRHKRVSTNWRRGIDDDWYSAGNWHILMRNLYSGNLKSPGTRKPVLPLAFYRRSLLPIGNSSLQGEIKDTIKCNFLFYLTQAVKENTCKCKREPFRL